MADIKTPPPAASDARGREHPAPKPEPGRGAGDAPPLQKTTARKKGIGPMLAIVMVILVLLGAWGLWTFATEGTQGVSGLEQNELVPGAPAD